jgi:hypothetical protein
MRATGAWDAVEIVARQRFGIRLWAVARLAFLVFVAGIEVGFLQICPALRARSYPRSKRDEDP